MTGHQAQAWHPGIAAKFFLARALADRACGAAVWLTPDQDVTEPHRVRVPVIGGGRLAAREIDLAEASAAGAPAAMLPAKRTRAIGWGNAEPALESVRKGIERHAARLDERSREASAARQVAGAMEAALGERGRADAKLWASELAARGALDELIDAMRWDAAACAHAYNAAAEAQPDAGVAALRLVGERVELPLWRLANGMRRRVWSDELGEIDGAELAPRALVMTAAARLDLCDLFIHGTGGAAYDRVMEAWIRDWLGEETALRLAPVAVATADVLLPLDELATDDAAIEAAAWRAHAARHDPALLGDEAAAAEKRELVGQIEAAKAAGESPAPLFRAMHELLKRVRREHAGRLEELEKDAERLAPMRGSGELARDRTWAVFLHEDSVIDELARRAAATAAKSSRAPAPRG
jgi:hypothetical protein